MKRLDLSGRKFGRLTAVGDAGADAKKRRRWLCVCECGKETTVVTSKLTTGHTRSCGCLLVDKNRELRQTHGHATKGDRSLTYKSYTNMVTRCENQNAVNYDRYGGVGVSICERWRFGEGGKSGFECFLADMGERPSPQHSIDRRRSSIGYHPDNCRWVIGRVQVLNRGATVLIDVGGFDVPLIVACELAGVKYGTAWARLKRGHPWNGAAK